MSFNPNTVDNMWELEDFTRRVTQRLFDPTLSPEHQARNRQYRMGLLQILDGLANETPAAIIEGMNRIADHFPRVEPRAVPASPDHEAE